LQKAKEYWHKVNSFLDRFFENERAIQISFWIILALNVFYKFFFLEEMHVKHDDAFTIFYSQQSLSELYAELAREANPPLYFTLLHFWIKLFGIGPVAVKSLSALFSTGAAVVTFHIGKKHMNLLGAFTASCLFLFSDVHFDFSHEVRAFSLVFLLASLSIYFFLNLLDKTSWKNIVALCLVNTLLPYAHYTSVLLPITEALILLFLIPKRIQDFLRIGVGFVASAILFIPQLLNFKDTIPDDDFWLGKPGLHELKLTFFKLSGHDPSYRNMKYALFAGLVLLVANFFFKTFSRRFDFKKLLLFIAVFFIPIYLNYWIAQYTPVFRVRYMLFASIGIFLALAYVLSSLRIPVILRLVLCLFFVLPFFESFNPSNRGYMRWDKVAEMVKEKQNENMVFYVLPTWRKNDFSYYFNREYFSKYSKRDSLMEADGFYSIYDYHGIKKNHKGKEVVLIIGDYKDSEKNISKTLVGQGYSLDSKWYESSDITVEHWSLEQNN